MTCRVVEKKLIEDIYTLGQSLGLDVWCEDEAGPFQAIPQPGASWQSECSPAKQPHEYIRNGTAKVLTLFHPADGQVRIKGTTTCPNTVSHPWLEQELADIMATLADLPPTADQSRAAWERWQQGLKERITLLAATEGLVGAGQLGRSQELGIGDVAVRSWNYAFVHPSSGLWLNMAESIQRILKGRAISGEEPTSPAQIIEWFVAVAKHWNADPTPFVWGGKRAARRKRQRDRAHSLGG